MFVTQAHSFAQQARLAITLAWVAGFTNTVAILACGHVTSHVSGTTSELGLAAAAGNLGKAAFLCFLLLTFLAGAALAGIATEIAGRKRWESVYVLPMAAEAVLLGLFALAIELAPAPTPTTPDGESLSVLKIQSGLMLFLVTGLASMAMGLQNATVTRISAGIVRTTHVTGVLTDLGLELVHLVLAIRDAVRGKDTLGGRVRSFSLRPTTRRTALLASILGSFALGAGLGAVLYGFAPRVAMFPPVLFLAWIIYQDITKPIAEIEPSELVGETGLAELPPEIGVFHLKQDQKRAAGGTQRLPDLVVWADRLDKAIRVAVLDLTDVTKLDSDAAGELKALTDRFATTGRRLVIAGVTPEQYAQLIGAGWSERGRLAQVGACPDLELAVARALAML